MTTIAHDLNAGIARRTRAFRATIALGLAAVTATIPVSDAFAQSARCGALVHAWQRSNQARGAVNGLAMHASSEANQRERMAALRCHNPARRGLPECRNAIRGVEQQVRARRAHEQLVRNLGGEDRAQRLAAQHDELDYEMRQCQRSARGAPVRLHDFDENPNPRRPTPEESAAVLIGGLVVGAALAGGLRGRGIGRGPVMHGPGMHGR